MYIECLGCEDFCTMRPMQRLDGNNIVSSLANRKHWYHIPRRRLSLTYQNVTYTLYQLFKISEIDNFFTAAKSLTLFTVIYSYLSNFIKGGGPAKKLQTIKTHCCKDL